MNRKSHFTFLRMGFAKAGHVLAVLAVLLSTLALGVGPSWADPNYGLAFNGTNAYVTFGPAPSLGLSTFTIELWFRRDSAGTTTTTGTGGVTAVPLMTKGRGEGDGSNVDMNYFLGISSTGVLAADFEDMATGLNHPVSGVTPIVTGVWHHAAVTYDGAKWQLFLNGKLETELVVGQSPRSDSIQHAGLGTAMTSAGATAGYFSGAIDEARIWNYARTQQQITDNMPLEITIGTGLVARWGLNEGTGTNAGNSIIGGVNGTLTNGPTWVNGSPFAVELNALYFGGTNAYVTFGNAAALGLPQFTLETWFRRDGVGATTSTGSGGVTAVPLITKGRAENDASNVDLNYFLGISGTGNFLVADFEEGLGGTSRGLNHPITGTTSIANGIWYHAAVTYDGSTWRLYLNGNLDNQLTVGQPPRSDSIQHAGLATAINSSGVQTGYFNGIMDEARIWNYARTQAEILSTINAEITSAQTGLVGRWALDERTGTVIYGTAGTTVNGALIGSNYAWTNGAPFNLAFTPPAAPSGLNAASASAYQVDLTWTDNASNESSFEIERAYDVPGPFVLVATVGANTAAYVDATVAAATQYCYRARAVNAIGASDYSDVSCVMTQAENASALDLGGTNAYVTFGEAPTLKLAQFTLEGWFKREGAGTTANTGDGGFLGIPLITKGVGQAEGSNVDMNYFLGIHGTNNVICADFEEGAGGVGPLGLNHPVCGTTPIQNYQWYHVAATYNGTWNLYLNGELEATLAVNQPLRSDSIQHAGLGVALNSTGVASGHFDGVLDEARIWNVALNQADIANNINSQITVPQTGLVARWGLNEGGGTAVNGTAGTGVNGTVTGADYAWVTPGAPFDISFAPPSAPTGLSASSSSDTQVYLTWQDNSNNESSFQIERSTDGGATFAPAGMASANVPSFTDGGLTASTQYCYRVYAQNLGGVSGYSNTACATTRATAAYALDFGAANAYVTFGDANALDLTQFTLETWFRRDGPGATTTTGTAGVPNAIPLISNGAQEAENANADINYVLCIDNSTGALCADFEEGASGASPGLNHPVIGITPIVTGQWYHAAVTYDGTTWRLYLNGSLERELTVGRSVNAANVSANALATMLNTTNVTNGFFDGVLDEVRIWDFARTQTEIRGTINSELSAAQTGLVGRWNLDEGSGTVVNGSAGTTTNGNIVNTGSAWVAGAPFNLNFNLAPDAPVLVSPANGATGVATAPTLAVNASDPEGDPLTVTFYGREKNAVGADFTLVAIPDPQYYAASYPAIYNAQMQWVADNQASSNIAYVASLGDNVDVASNMTQWANADTAWDILDAAGVPYGLTAGNHDGAPSGTANFNANFGEARFAGKPYYGGHYGSDNDNHYALFEASGMQFIVVFIEYDDGMTATTHPVLVWANDLLQTHSTRRAIVVTHNLLQGGSNAFTTQGQTIYNALRDNSNLFLMMGGHLDIAARRTDVYNGNTVFSLRSDYQNQNSQQSGYLRVMRFSPADNTIYVNTYSPTLNKNYDGSSIGESIFSLPYSMGGAGSYTLIGSASVASGANASVPWPNLASTTEYEWYATVGDGNKTTTGATWSFTTGSGNSAPIAADDVYNTNEDEALTVAAPGVLMNDADADNDPLTAVKVSDPTHGALTLNADGSFTYTPATDFTGADSFTYQANDGAADSNTATVTINVNQVTPPPVLPSSFYGELHIFDNPPAVGGAVTIFAAGAPVAVAAIRDNNSALVYSVDVPGDDPATPGKEGGVEGEILTFKIGDRVVANGTWHGGTNTRLDFHPPQALPGGPYSGDEGSVITFTGAANDAGTDAATFQWDWENDGVYDYTGQTAGYTWPDDGPHTVALKVTDAQNGEGMAVVEVTIHNAAPVVNAGANATLNEGDTFIGVGSFADPGADTWMASVDYGDGSGIQPLALNPDKTFSLSHAYADNGDYVVTVTVADEDGGSGFGALTVTVNDVPPAANAGGPYSGTAGEPVELTGSATCAPVDVCAYEWVLDGNIIGTSPTIFYTWNTAGAYTVTFRVADGDGNVAASDVTVTISPAHQQLALVTGWNLVSFNLIPPDTNIAAVLASLNGNYDLVFAWDAQTGAWLKHDPAAPPYVNTLTTLDRRQGFWIRMTTGGTLDVAGDVPAATSITLSAGWNLVGYPSMANRDLPGALSDHGAGNFSLVYAYHANDTADPWKLFDGGAAFYDLTALTPGWGYWVKTEGGSDQTWTVLYLAP